MSKFRNSDVADLAETFRVLGNPHRLAIFLRLAECRSPGKSGAPGMRSCVGDIGGDLAIAPSTVSHHLKELRGAGLIHMERAGKTIECWVEPKTVKALAKFFRKAVAGGA